MKYYRWVEEYSENTFQEYCLAVEDLESPHQISVINYAAMAYDSEQVLNSCVWITIEFMIAIS